MDSDEATLKEPRTISKAAFEPLVGVTIVLLAILETVAVLALSRALGLRFEVGWIGGLMVLNMVLARTAVDRVLKRFGLSRNGISMERRGRTVATTEGDVVDDEVVEVRVPRSLVRFFFWSCLASCALFAAGSALVPHLAPWLHAMGYVLSAFFGLGALQFLLDRKPQAWADREGITGYPGQHFRRRFLPWSNIASCEIETFFDTFGKPVLIWPTLKGWNGEPLMPLNLLYTSMEDQERLMKYIKAKLPKPKDDFWE